MKSTTVRALAGLLALLLLGAIVWFFAGRRSSRPVAAAPAAGPAPANRAALEKVQSGIKAQLAHDNDRADILFDAALAMDPTLKGVVYQRAVVAFNGNHLDAARTFANDSIARHEEVSASHVLLGTMLGLQHDHAGALAEFLAAAAADPANPLPLYNASESLRELHRPDEAIAKLRDAIQRTPAEPLYAFKLRLARIEADQEREMEAEIRQQLALKPPAGDWILTAAAISLKHGRLGEAAGLMSAARQVMQPALFFSLIQDPLFKHYQSFSEIAPFYDVKFTPVPSPAPFAPAGP